LQGRYTADLFKFNQLSEGEKQLVAAIGAIQLINQPDNLVLLDEPDTHLNPQWSWEYSAMLAEAFNDQQRPRSTILMATHNPVMISGLTRDQVLLAHPPSDEVSTFYTPGAEP
jgi:ABC-type ATPase involved in cell division